MMVLGLLVLLLHATFLTSSVGSSRARKKPGEMKGNDYYMNPVKEITEATWTEKDNGKIEEMDYEIKPVLTVVVNKTEFDRVHKEAEVKITNTFKPRPASEQSPWVQVNDDSKASAKTNTIAEITYKTWIKDNNFDCETRMAECMKALVDITNVLKAAEATGEDLDTTNSHSQGSDYNLNPDFIDTDEERSAFCDQPEECINELFSNFDGRCNNLVNERWGSKNPNYRRLLGKSFYKRNQSLPTPLSEADGLPAPHDVSSQLMTSSDVIPDNELSTLFMQYGQFLSHDITQAAFDTALPEVCGGRGATEFCQQFHGKGTDEKSENFFLTSMRSDPNYCKFSEHQLTEQVNGFTAFIDGTQIYSYREDLLKQSSPPLILNDDIRKLDPEGCADPRCVAAPNLRALHYLFTQEHNRIVEGLLNSGIEESKINKNSKDANDRNKNTLNIARKIVVAQMQAITYGAWLPILLGEDVMKKHELSLGESEYDEGIDPTLYNEFTTAAMRFGHSAINGDTNTAGPCRHELRDSIFNSTVGGDNIRDIVSDLLQGASNSACDKIDHLVTNGMRNHDKVRFVGGKDLAAVNIARGRDHGMPPYFKVREHFGLSSYDPALFEPDVVLKLDQLYKNSRFENKAGAATMDLWVGGLAEKPHNNAKVGPIFANIIAQQFKNIKFGDRYFFTHSNKKKGARGLPLILREMIQQRTLRDVICDNSKSSIKVRTDVFNFTSPELNCGEQRTELDFNQIVQEFEAELESEHDDGEIKVSQCKTTSGENCVFPFKWASQQYSKCTFAGANEKAWCSTKTDDLGNHVKENFGECPTTCETEDIKAVGKPHESCKTDETSRGNNANKACIFPFQLMGVWHNECTLAYSEYDDSLRHWCSVKNKVSGVMEKDHWGYCRPDCPKEGIDGACIAVSGKRGGSACVFSFGYKNVTYTKCSRVDQFNNKPWCSLKVDELGNHIKGWFGNCGPHCEVEEESVP